jgi:predicted RND superfamily exporter protein
MNNGNFVTSLGDFVTRYPWRVIFITLVLVISAGSGIQHLEFDNNYRIYFSKNNPQLLAFDAIQNTYNKSDNLMFIVEPANGDIFTKNNLQAIVELTETAWQLPYSSRVDSLSNFQHTIAEQDDLIVDDLVTEPKALTEQRLQYIKQVALHEPLLLNKLISTTGHVAGVNVTLQLPGINPTEAMEVSKFARSIAKDFMHKHPDIKLHLTGIVMLNNAFAEAALSDLSNLLPVMYAVVFIVLILSLRSFTATISVFLISIFSIFSAIGLAIWLGIKITPNSGIAPTIILTMVIADCVHFLVSLLHNIRLGHEKHEAIKESLRSNIQPTFLTSITTAIGFLSMNFSDAPPFRDLGNIVAIGVSIAFILTITFLPALMTVLPIKTTLKDEPDNAHMKIFAEFVIRKRKWLLWGNALLALLLISLVPLNELNDEFVQYFDETFEFRRATDFLNANMGGIYTIEVAFDTGSEGEISNPIFLHRVNAFKEWLLLQPGVKHVNTISDTFKRLNKSLHEDNPNKYQLPKKKDLAAQYLLLYEMSLPYGLDLTDQINLDKSGIRMVITLVNKSTSEMVEFEQRIKTWLGKNMAEYKPIIGSIALMFSHIGKRNVDRMLLGTLIALVLISILLMVAFKSVKLGLISLIPNLAPAGMAFGIWALVDGKIGMALSIVTGLTIGIVVDDTVHFISKYRRARLEQNYSPIDAVRYAFSTVGIALWVTSLVLVSGFLVLSASHFTMNSAMGLLTAITIAVALFLDFLLLPPLLMTLEKK